MMIPFFGFSFLAQTQRMDQRITPAEERSFTSPNHKFTLRVFTLDHWKTREPLAVLSQGKKVIWSSKLPHSHGPRFAVVTNLGVSVLIDESINIASERAVTIVPVAGLSGQRVWSYSQVRQALGIEPKALSRMAKFGPWVSDSPTLKGSIVHIAAGGKTLLVDTKSMTLHAEA